MRENGLRVIFDKTNGHCHFCGDPIKFQNRGWCEKPDGHWEVDHVIQRDKGGTKSAENCLPACMRCNRLRWHRTGDSIRDILLLGIIARKEIKNSSRIGRELLRLRAQRLIENEARRRRGLAPRS
jgi:hypothetical protein